MIHSSLHPPMSIRPDEVIRSGIIQPFGVRSVDPVTFARHEIDPFIQAIRPGGPNSGGVTMDGALGITTATRMPLAGAFGAGEDSKAKYKMMGAGAAGAVLGALATWLLLRK